MGKRILGNLQILKKKFFTNLYLSATKLICGNILNINPEYVPFLKCLCLIVDTIGPFGARRRISSNKISLEGKVTTFAICFIYIQIMSLRKKLLGSSFKLRLRSKSLTGTRCINNVKSFKAAEFKSLRNPALCDEK